MGRQQDPDERIRIAEVSAGYDNVGGIETYLNMLNMRLARDYAVDIHVVYPTPNPGESQTIEGGRGRIITHPLEYAEEPRGKKDLRKFSSQLRNIVRENNIDIMHLHTPYNLTMTTSCGLSILHGVPLAITSHGAEMRDSAYVLRSLRKYIKEGPLSAGSFLVGHSLSKLTIACASSKTGVSLAAARVLGRKTKVIGSFVDSEFYSPELGDGEGFLKEQGLSGRKVILYPARICRDKQQLDAVKAVELINDPNIALFIVGPAERDESKEYVKEIKRYVDEKKLGGKVILRDSAFDEKQLRDAYSGCLLNIMTSAHEGLGLTILEAGSMKVPTVAYRIPGVDEAVKEGETGVLVEQGDISALAKALEITIRDDTELARMGNAARMRVESNYNQDAVAKECVRIYKRILRP